MLCGLSEKLKRLERERKADAEEWGMLQASLTEKLHAVEKEASQKVAEERRLLKEEMDKHRQERVCRVLMGSAIFNPLGGQDFFQKTFPSGRVLFPKE